MSKNIKDIILSLPPGDYTTNAIYKAVLAAGWVTINEPGKVLRFILKELVQSDKIIQVDGNLYHIVEGMVWNPKLQMFEGSK